jgi:hypothetical protein
MTANIYDSFIVNLLEKHDEPIQVAERSRGHWAAAEQPDLESALLAAPFCKSITLQEQYHDEFEKLLAFASVPVLCRLFSKNPTLLSLYGNPTLFSSHDDSKSARSQELVKMLLSAEMWRTIAIPLHSNFSVVSVVSELLMHAMRFGFYDLVAARLADALTDSSVALTGDILDMCMTHVLYNSTKPFALDIFRAALAHPLSAPEKNGNNLLNSCLSACRFGHLQSDSTAIKEMATLLLQDEKVLSGDLSEALSNCVTYCRGRRNSAVDVFDLAVQAILQEPNVAITRRMVRYCHDDYRALLEAHPNYRQFRQRNVLELLERAAELCVEQKRAQQQSILIKDTDAVERCERLIRKAHRHIANDTQPMDHDHPNYWDNRAEESSEEEDDFIAVK